MTAIDALLQDAADAMKRADFPAAVAALDRALASPEAQSTGAAASGRAALLTARARAHLGAAAPAAALEDALAADQLVAAVTADTPSVRVGTLALSVECAIAAGADAAAATLAGYLADQSLNARDRKQAVAGKVLQAEALLRLGRDQEALESARIAATQGAKMSLDDRDDWVVRGAQAQGAAARRLGLALEAYEALGMALAEAKRADSGGASEHLRLLHATSVVAFDGPRADAAVELEALARSNDGALAAAAALTLAEIAAAAGRDGEAASWLTTAEAAGDADPGRVSAVQIRLAIGRQDSGAALAMARALTDRAPGYLGSLLLSDAQLASGEPVDALATLDRALDQAIASGSRLGQVQARYRRAALTLHLGDVDGARADARQGLALAAALHAPSEIATGYALVARALLVTEQVDEAMEALGEAVDTVFRMGASHRGAEMALMSAFAERAWPEAGELGGDGQNSTLNASLTAATAVSDLRLAAMAHLVLAPRVWAAGQRDAARDHVGRARALDARGELGLAELIGEITGPIGLGQGSA